MEQQIKVTGKGTVHVVPDLMQLHITLKSLHDDYDGAYQQGTLNTQRLTQVMTENALSPQLVKTTSFDISQKKEYEYDKYDHVTGHKFVGFELVHHVRIDLGMDNAQLSQVVKLIGKYLKQAEISIGCAVKDPHPVQMLMLERAVKDAKERAVIMATASGCSLGKVLEINNSLQHNEVHIYKQVRNLGCADEAVCCSADSLNITPTDFSVSDMVTIIWQLNEGV